MCLSIMGMIYCILVLYQPRASCLYLTCSTCATPFQVEHALKLSSTVMLFGGPDATTADGSTPRHARNRLAPARCTTQQLYGSVKP
jgi:hypothetical protein